jgi:hypothetical protein
MDRAAANQPNLGRSPFREAAGGSHAHAAAGGPEAPKQFTEGGTL